MSKKIAQLTKVIYALNSKNDDQEMQLTAVQDAYEAEIEEMLLAGLLRQPVDTPRKDDENSRESHERRAGGGLGRGRLRHQHDHARDGP